MRQGSVSARRARCTGGAEMELERWASISDYEGIYEVSDHGNVRSLDRHVARNGGRLFARGRVLRAYSRPDGRPTVGLAKDGVTTTHVVPTLVLTAFVGPRPAGLDGCHNDGDASNNRLSNLRWDTRSANCHDRVRHGKDRKRARTHCPRGHLLAEPNLVASSASQGHRACLACSRARAAQRKAARRGQPFDLQAVSDARYAAIIGLEE